MSLVLLWTLVGVATIPGAAKNHLLVTGGMPASSFSVFNACSLSSMFFVSVLDRAGPPWDSTKNTMLQLASPRLSTDEQLLLSYQERRNDRAVLEFYSVRRGRNKMSSDPDNHMRMTPGYSQDAFPCFAYIGSNAWNSFPSCDTQRTPTHSFPRVY